MLGVGWTEMLLIGVVALIVIGPKELPALMQKLGRFAGTVRRMGSDFQRELNRTTGLDEVKNLRTAITQPLKATTDAIRKEFNTTTSSGAVQPSGAIKPADPAAQSIVNEIHQAAGMPVPAEPIKTAPVKIDHIATPAKNEPVKAAVPAKTVASAPSSASAELAAPAVTTPPAKPKAARKPRQAKSVGSPAPVEAIAPAKPVKAAKTAAKKKTAKKTTAKKTAAKKS
jgi:sec-independent protein translocase protein TatB